LDIDTQGALNVKKNFPEAVLIFILPPSLKELKRRLESRGTDDEETIKKRLKIAREEIKRAPLYDYVVVNDVLEIAFDNLRSIIKAEKCRAERLKGQFSKLLKDKEILNLISEERNG